MGEARGQSLDDNPNPAVVSPRRGGFASVLQFLVRLHISHKNVKPALAVHPMFIHFYFTQGRVRNTFQIILITY
jgi:hypothetical protein